MSYHTAPPSLGPGVGGGTPEHLPGQPPPPAVWLGGQAENQLPGAVLPMPARACLKNVNMSNQRVFCPLDGAIFP